MQYEIERLLFETGAIRVAPEDKPFWYTSGTIGPYYSNTQNLIGGEDAANEALSLIDAAIAGDRLEAPSAISRHMGEAYERSACYRTVAGYIAERVENSVDIGEVDIISGGERRDWFFSYIAAKLLNKPHLTIYKDLSMVLSPELAGKRAAYVGDGELAGIRCLHVSDIVTEASSYTRAWAPALAKAGTRIGTSLTILDRLQGGGAALASLGIRHLTLAAIDAGFFERAHGRGDVSGRQLAQILEYIKDPNGAMRAFLKAHPEFLRGALAAGGKEGKLARACVDSKVYGEFDWKR